jgi:hypothetical protein
MAQSFDVRIVYGYYEGDLKVWDGMDVEVVVDDLNIDHTVIEEMACNQALDYLKNLTLAFRFADSVQLHEEETECLNEAEQENNDG